MSPRNHAPDQESAEESVATAVAEPPVPETNGNSQSFADRVRQRQWAAASAPFGGIFDTDAKVYLFEGRQGRQMTIKFGQGRPEDKPSQAVIDKMKEAGYRWHPSQRIWAHPVRSESAMGTRIEAERLYQDVCNMIRLEKGIESGPELSR